MKVIIFGTTGMIGRGVLQECLLDAEVDAVLTLVDAVLTVFEQQI